MSNFVIVTAADSESESVFTHLGGRAISARIAIVPWSGTAEQLHRRVAAVIPRVVLIASLNGDCLLGGI